VPEGTPAQPGEPEWFVGDLQTGIGLAAAVEGVTTVAHCATSARGEAQMGAQLMIAAARAGRPHLVFPCVVRSTVQAVRRLQQALDGALSGSSGCGVSAPTRREHEVRRPARAAAIISWAPICASPRADVAQCATVGHALHRGGSPIPVCRSPTNHSGSPGCAGVPSGTPDAACG